MGSSIHGSRIQILDGVQILRSAAGQREHQFIETLDERRRILELTAFGQRRLVEQDVAPVGEPRLVRLVVQPPDDGMAGIDLEHRLRRRDVLARGLQHALEVRAHRRARR